MSHYYIVGYRYFEVTRQSLFNITQEVFRMAMTAACHEMPCQHIHVAAFACYAMVEERYWLSCHISAEGHLFRPCHFRAAAELVELHTSLRHLSRNAATPVTLSHCC